MNTPHCVTLSFNAQHLCYVFFSAIMKKKSCYETQMYKYLIKRLLSFIWALNVDLSLLNHTVIPYSFFKRTVELFSWYLHRLKFLPAIHECFNLSTPVQKGVAPFYSWLHKRAQSSSYLLCSHQNANQSSDIDAKTKPNKYALKGPI